MFPMAPLLCVLLACSTCPDLRNQTQQISSTRAIPSDLLITLERTSCRGACPIYTLKISADGVVIYHGKQFVRTRRRVRAILAQEHLRQLLSEFEKADFFSLRDRYQSWSDGCPSAGRDFPWAITSIRINGRAKTITHDHGCRERWPNGPVYPAALFALEQRIDEIVGTSKWTK
jgi:Domain of unknown function (DUF6438)